MTKKRTQRKTVDMEKLGDVLEELDRVHGIGDLSPDPLEVVREYPNASDQEAAGLIASSLAYGNVRQIVKSVRRALEPLGEHPARTLKGVRPDKALRLARGFRHRLHNEIDLARLYLAIGKILKQHGSLDAAFASASAGDVPLRERLDAFVRLLHKAAHSKTIENRQEGKSYFDHLLPIPSRGSACKRLNLFLLWMVRPDDGIHFGIWKSLTPDQLLMPLDTHVWRIGRYLGLIDRATPDWKAARQLTDRLSEINPDDPTRYDFAISRLGIHRLCQSRAAGDHCRQCALKGVCVRVD
ncbi:MAG: TIGR02757 family protein [Candidatus Sumerlaeota bacterium]